MRDESCRWSAFCLTHTGRDPILSEPPQGWRSDPNSGASMKLITAVVRPERLTAVKEALFRVGVTGMTLSRVSGHGGEREVVEHYRGSALVLEFRDKVKIEAAVSEPFVEPTIRAIVAAARTGEVGDGQIF